MDSSIDRLHTRSYGLIPALALVTLMGLTPPSLAQEPPNYSERIRLGGIVQGLDQDAFGERFDRYTGELTFFQKDVVLAGTGPDIVVGRTYSAGRHSKGDGPAGFADWAINIPHIATRTPRRQVWQVGSSATAKLQRCSSFDLPAISNIPGNAWWDGYTLTDEHGNTRVPLQRVAENQNAPDGNPGSYPIVTRDGWQISCLPATANGEPGEAFLATSPQGVRYWLNWLVTSRRSRVFLAEMPLGPPLRETIHTAMMLATRVEDRFGNWINYNYDGDRLTSITASDGRTVSFSWNDALVTTVQASGRSWAYGYINGVTPVGGSFTSLGSMTQPDGSRMTFDLRSFYALRIRDDIDNCQIYPSGPSEPATNATITGPSGLNAEYRLTRVRLGRSNVPFECVQGDVERSSRTPATFDRYALTGRRYWGPGINWQWQYGYGSPNPSWNTTCATSSCTRSSTREETLPDNRRQRFTYSNEWGETEGKLLVEEVGVSGASAVRATRYAYAPSSGMPYPARLGTFLTEQIEAVNAAALTRLVPANEITIEQDGDWFRTRYDAFDAFGFATLTTQSSSLGDQRQLRTDFEHNTHRWVLGTPRRTVHVGTNVIMDETVYDGRVLPIERRSFNRRVSTAEYAADGTLSVLRDGNGNITAAADWYRGIPRLLTHPDGTLERVEVNDSGWITAHTDENGLKTCFEYDAMGRIQRTLHPSEAQPGTCDETSWNATHTTFEPIDSAEFHLPAGHWRRTQTTGTAIMRSYYDAMWRPVIEQQYDSADAANTQSLQRQEFNFDGQPVFTSYKVADTGQWNQGVWTEYDALGRTTSVSQDSEHGLLSTINQYTGGHRVITVDPRQQSTTTQFSPYGSPAYSWPEQIQHPESASTNIQRDAFGKPLLIERRSR